MTAVLGKAPDSPEFVREGQFGEPEAMLEAALAAQVERGRGLAAARFLVAGAGYVRVGAWIASRDALGREFPLALSLQLPEQSLLSIVPLHYVELLDAAEEALHARLRGIHGVPYLTAPHASLLVPRVHRTRAALLHESAKRFQLRVLGALDTELLIYTLATLLRAAELEEPVALVLPSAREDALFACMELLGALAPTHALSLVWSADGEQAWLGWDMELAELLASDREAWPLRSDDAAARGDARDYLGEELCGALERDCAMAVVFDRLARIARYPRGV